MSEEISNNLLSTFTSHGYQARIVSIDHLVDLDRSISSARQDGSLDEIFYKEYLSQFSFTPPPDLPHALSLIVVATPRPKAQVHFTWEGTDRPVTIPPTYVGYRAISQHIASLAGSVLNPPGFSAIRTRLPLKLLAVHSGLGRYGRNNICYVPGMGSFHELVGLYTDLPCGEDNWAEAQLLDRCRQCSACQRHCPTQAIPTDRFILRAERCLTFHNERAASIPFPGWISPRAHNALVGCTVCQDVCPENRPQRDRIDQTVTFSQEETNLLMKGKPLDDLLPDTQAKIRQLEMTEYFEMFPRNLRALFSST